MTRQLGLSVLEKALYTRLTTNSNTSSYRVYTYVPSSAKFPYIRIGDYIGIPSPSFNNRDCPNEDNVAVIHAWSEKPQNKEALDMMNAVIQAIEASSLSITGYSSPFLAIMEYSDMLIDDLDPNNIKRHGVIRYRFSMGSSS